MLHLNLHTNAVVKIIIFISSLLAVFVILNTTSPKAHAAYEHGRLIDNSVFLDSKAMSKSQIQNFLVSRNSGLKDMKFKLQCYGSDSKEREWYTSAGAKCDVNIPASHIIYYAAQIYGVNPRVILATMQKEQSLITAQNPTNWQLSQAMGYACPTSGSCNSSSNFSYQVDSGTWVLRYHYERARGNNTWWNNNGWTCGTGKPSYYMPNLYPNQNVQFIDPYSGIHYVTVNIRNAATSAFYCYTPHVFNNHSNSPHPNQTKNPRCWSQHPASGNKGMCYTGSYNFVLFFELWFGTTRGNNTLVVSRNLQYSPVAPNEGDTVGTSFILRNDNTSAVTINEVVVAARDSSGNNVNFPSETNITLQPGEEYEYYQHRTFDNPGIHDIWIAARLPSGDWSRTWPDSSNNNIRRERSFRVYEVPDVTMVENLKYSPQNLTTDDTVSTSFVIKNNENKKVTIRDLVVAARDGSNHNVNFRPIHNLTLAPGQEYKYSAQRKFTNPGDHKLWVAVRLPSGDWSRTWPDSINGGIIRERDFEVKAPPNITITRNLQFSPNPPLAGQPTATSFVVKNNETEAVTINELLVAARDRNGNNVNFPSETNITLQPGEEYEYYEHRTFDNPGDHNIWIAARLPSGAWSRDWPRSASSGIVRDRTIGVKIPHISLARDLKYSPVNPGVGVTVGSSFVIRNNESRVVTIKELVVAGRDSDSNNVNFPSETNITLQPGEEYEYYKHREFNNAGAHNLWIAVRLPNDDWSRTWPTSSSQNMIRDRNFTVQP